MMWPFILSSGELKITCWPLEQKHSSWKSLAFIILPLHWMWLLQVRAKIVTSPLVAEVFKINGPFSHLFNIFTFLAKLTTEQAWHNCHLSCGWITCWSFKAIPQCPICLECLDLTFWFWHEGLIFLVLVLVLVHHSFSTWPPRQCYKNA